MALGTWGYMRLHENYENMKVYEKRESNCGFGLKVFQYIILQFRQATTQSYL